MTSEPHDLHWWIALLWPVLTAIINAGFRAKTPEEWALVCESSPRFAGFIRLLRATGLDLHKTLEALQQMAGKQ